MLEYNWEYILSCDECGIKRRYYMQDLNDSLNDVRSNGWLIKDGVVLCGKCRLEKEMPCKKCNWYEDEVCTNEKSQHCADFVLASMHCECWEERSGD